MTALGVLLSGVGVLFVASGIKDLDPVQVVRAIIAGDPVPGARSGARTTIGGAAPTHSTVGGTVGAAGPSNPAASPYARAGALINW